MYICFAYFLIILYWSTYFVSDFNICNNILLLFLQREILWKKPQRAVDFLYPSEGIHRRWYCGYWITFIIVTPHQDAFILRKPENKLSSEVQETPLTSIFPSTHVKVWFILINLIHQSLLGYYNCWKLICYSFILYFQEKWSRNIYISLVCFGHMIS